MKFSVLIAHYNNAEYFKDCFASLKAQSFSDFEVIIVDDCSEESEIQSIKKIINSDSRFKLFINEENKGVGFTKRKCVELSCGEICGFLDPDDALTPDAIEESIKAYQDSEIVATYSQFYVCDGNLKPQKYFDFTRKIKNGNSKFFNIRFEVAHFFTFKRAIYLKTNGINENITSSVDQDLYLKMYDLGNFFFIKKPLYLYRIHEKGVSQEKNKKQKLYRNWHSVLYETLERRNIHKLYGKEINEIASLPEFIYQKQNSIISGIKNKFKRLLQK